MEKLVIVAEEGYGAVLLPSAYEVVGFVDSGQAELRVVVYRFPCHQGSRCRMSLLNQCRHDFIVHRPILCGGSPRLGFELLDIVLFL